MKKITLIVLLFLLMGSAVYFTLPIAKENIQEQIRKQAKYALSPIIKFIVKQNIILDGFKIVEQYPAIIESPDNTLVFVGHIYPKTAARYKNQDNERPLLYLTEIIDNTPPKQIIFGGDNVVSPSDAALKHLLKLKQRLKTNTRFVIGNHDGYWDTLIKKPIFSSIYHQRYWYEDVNNVRLIYLHTINKKGKYTIDEEQLNFLAKTLDPTQYRYALIFQHHALWAGADKYSNESSRVIKAKTLWKNKMLPLMKRGNVQAVFAGDGGNRAEGQMIKLDTIPHYLTGWSRSSPFIPPEWLTIKLTKTPQVTWHKLFAGRHYIKTP